MDLGYVLRRAWEITWQHKPLWLCGFLVSLGTVGARVGIGSGGTRGGWIGREYPPEVQRAVSGFLSSPYSIVAVVVLVLLVVAIGVGLTVLGALGRAALVDQVQAAEDRGGVSLRAGWEAGGRHLWAVFLIRLLLGLPAAGVTLTGMLPATAMLFWVAGQERPEVVIPGVFALPVALLTCVFPAICLAVASFPLRGPATSAVIRFACSASLPCISRCWPAAVLACAIFFARSLVFSTNCFTVVAVLFSAGAVAVRSGVFFSL